MVLRVKELAISLMTALAPWDPRGQERANPTGCPLTSKFALWHTLDPPSKQVDV